MRREATLVAAWDDAAGQPEWRRPLVLAAALTAVDGEDAVGADTLADRPLGEVAARLVAVGLQLGERVEAIATCGACEEQLEVAVPLADLPGLDELPDPEPFVVDTRGWHVTARLPTPADLRAAAAAPGADEAERAIVDCCVLSADPPAGDRGRSGDLPAAVVEEVAREMEDRDPAGVVRARLTCGACGAEDDYVVDVAAWCWDVVDAYVQRLLDDVRRLASAYGWTEADVLALGPNRRAFYLELAP